ncbi:DinB family protein [Pseudopedobacter sp.]|uniref:DinB family protein n=1 Tax=Pseudopedobacter sp. TaxID=1936787 RepID=UPI00333EA645
MENSAIITPSELLKHWQGHRNVTRKLIVLFPEKELFEFTIGGMRPFSEMVKEFLAIAVPGLKELVSGENKSFNENHELKTKAQLLEAWDESTVLINELWSQLPQEKFREMNNLFGQYNFPVIDNILYFIDNEIHHRGQGYVYLRALGIEPPFFWERD